VSRLLPPSSTAFTLIVIYFFMISTLATNSALPMQCRTAHLYQNPTTSTSNAFNTMNTTSNTTTINDILLQLLLLLLRQLSLPLLLLLKYTLILLLWNTLVHCSPSSKPGFWLCSHMIHHCYFSMRQTVTMHALKIILHLMNSNLLQFMLLLLMSAPPLLLSPTPPLLAFYHLSICYSNDYFCSCYQIHHYHSPVRPRL
jgi:hypothetical protein